VGTKAGLVYLLDRANLRPVQEPLSPFTDQPLQPGHSLYLHSWWGIPMTTQSFVFYRPGGGQAGYAYAWPYNDRLRQLRYDYAQGKLQLTATADVPDVLGGGNLVLSADGSAAGSGILWAASRAGTGTEDSAGKLWAFDALSLKLLWQTQTPAFSKFNPPTVVRGRVFLPSTSPGTAATQQILVYGLP
jgi:outer membrane protein assembly factor BamB